MNRADIDRTPQTPSETRASHFDIKPLSGSVIPEELELISFEEKGTVGPQTIYNISITNNYATGETGAQTSQALGSGVTSRTTFIEESKSSVELIQLLTKLNNVDDASTFEQIRASFLSKFRFLKAFKSSREMYFYDLFQMIDLGITYLDFESINPNALRVFINAVMHLCKKLDADDLKKIRKQFRETKICFLPVVEEVDFEKEIKDFFRETST